MNYIEKYRNRFASEQGASIVETVLITLGIALIVGIVFGIIWKSIEGQAEKADDAIKNGGANISRTR